MRKNETPEKDAVSNFQYHLRSRDLPATQGMLHLVRTELKADIQELRAETQAGFRQIDARFSQVDGKFSQIDARFSQVDARFEQVLSEVARVGSEVARIGLLVEEQRSDNRIVLEGLQALWQRQERVEVRSIAQSGA